MQGIRRDQEPKNDRWRTEARSYLARRLLHRGHRLVIGLFALTWLTAACGDDTTTKTFATGGASSAGSGGAGATGGGTTTGGVGATGATSSGGAAPAGGSASGGSGAVGATGGAVTGGATTGGQAAGGTSSGGSATGGDAAGGTQTGGTAAGGSETGGDASGGQATGGDGTGGEATGGAGPTPVVPEKISDSDYRFTVGDLVLDVNPERGGRVTSLTLGGTDIIREYNCSSYDGNDPCNNSGSTIWTSPQSGWGTSWPPVAAIDGGAYTATVNGNNLVMKGSADSSLGAGITKDLSADSGTGWITMTFTIDATKAIQAAPWQITRVARGGLIVFPAVDITNDTEWESTEQDGYGWVDDEDQTSVVSPDGSKIIADGSGGWLAYIRNDNLFLIKYPDVASGDIAPEEGDVEVYHGDGYIELEVQGPYESIAANASSSPWTVQWRVVPVPGTVTVAVGDAGLIEFIEQEVAE